MRKKTLIILVILIVLVSILGVSYASWLFTDRQKDFNTLGSKCFEITMMNESEGITLDKTYPISDEEGLSTTGYTFTIKNTCNTYATYEVNLEDMLVEAKRLSGEYIKVSVNDGRPINLKELEEKEPTIKEADKSYELTSGTLAPEEETTYTIKLWMDESTPALEETMNATFLSKVSIEAGYIEEEKIENEILLEAKSITESLNNQSEIFEITGTSANYNLIEYSLDKEHWNKIENPGKTIVLTEEFQEEGKYSVYIRDEVGNIKSIEIETIKLDKTVPEIKIEETDNQENIELDITFTDNEGLSGYAITESKEEPTEWNEISGKETNIKYTLTENTTYYIWVKDSVGNLNYQMYSTDTIDTQAPELEITNSLTEWGTRDTITIQATDDVIGISGISISTTEGTYNWEVIENTLRYETTKEIEENGTYYISVKDAYGHITTKSIVIDKIDSFDPVASIKVNKDTTNVVVDASLSLDNESGIIKYEYSKDNTVWYTGSETYTFVGLDIGEYTIYVRVTDKVGRTNTTSTTIEVTFSDVLIECNKIDNAANCYLENGEKNTTELAYDETVDNNLRYIGANPNNYVLFNNELWRIIGVMNNIDDGTGLQESRIKLIRDESIGNYSWDNKESGVGSSISEYGSNDWSDSILQQVLNSGAYWNRTTGKCPYGDNGTTISCDFTSMGLTNEAKDMIDNAVWNLGSIDSYTSQNNGLAEDFYAYLSGSNVYEDNPLKWTGKIGLMYPSDYGFSVGGNEKIRRECLNTELYNRHNISDCNLNNWLLKNEFSWSILARANSSYHVFYLTNNGRISSIYAVNTYSVFPSLYLKSSIKITSGTGSSSDPFILKVI